MTLSRTLTALLFCLGIFGFVTSDCANTCNAQDTLPALAEGQSLDSFAAMWNGFDPHAEPLETEVLQEWEEEDVVMRIVRFRIGVFKGQKAMLAGVYGFPKSAVGGKQKLPGLLQIHGGGQYADYRACLTNAKRGYATVSIAWAGRIGAPKYRVSPDVVKLFWDGKTDDPQYKLTTDWGAVDGYHAPGRNPRNNFPSAKAEAWTLDNVESPRNSGWFLCALAARRALTFLEKQPEVDPNRLGVYGHSMGGKLTVMTASDPRVKAAAPSCGGISDRENNSEIFEKTICDNVNLKEVSCPIAFLSPSNDFHGRISDLPASVKEIQSKSWRVTCSPHLNHQDAPEYEVLTQLWFDQHLKNSFTLPKTPTSALRLDAADKIPTFSVTPDASRKILSVDVFYTHHGKTPETRFDRENTMSRFWHHAKAKRNGDSWTAKLPIQNLDKPLWAYANVVYQLDEPITGAGYYYGIYNADKFNLSSMISMVGPDALKQAGINPTVQPTHLIEDFRVDWQKEWFSTRPVDWPRTTHKLHDEKYSAPDNARLIFQARAADENKLVVVLDGFVAEVPITGNNEWQNVVLDPGSFKNFNGEGLKSWEGVRRLKLAANERLRPPPGDKSPSKVIGKNWVGQPPEFRNLHWHIRKEEPKRPTDQPKKDASTSSKLDVFPNPTFQVAESRAGQTKISTTFTPSKSLWAEGLQEDKVFHLQMSHHQGDDNSFELRMGVGGQVYSLRGPFGESVPPSFHGGHNVSPWNDEVWQFVAVCSKYNGLRAMEKDGELPLAVIEQIKKSKFKNSFFVHNSGAYIPGESEIKSLYCPLLSAEFNEESRTCRMLNWGLVPQVRTVHRSPILFYTQVRDAGDGVIEMTWVVHNFSNRDDVVFDHLNAPWGGTRISSLPFRYVSTTDSKLVEREQILRNTVVDVRKTAGWNLSCADESEDSPSLALVFGTDKHWEAEQKKKADGLPYCQINHSLYRDWRASEPMYEGKWKDWKTRPANSFRNYDVCEIIPKLQIQPGRTIWFRSFLVVGNKKKTIELANSVAKHVDYGLLDFAAESTPMLSIQQLNESDVSDVAYVEGDISKTAKVFSQPVQGTRPLFLIEHTKTGRQIVTTDPYFFVENAALDFELPADHDHAGYYQQARGYSIDKNHSNWKSLVGYAFVDKPESGNWQPLSKVLPESQFPKATQHHLDLWVKVD